MQKRLLLLVCGVLAALIVSACDSAAPPTATPALPTPTTASAPTTAPAPPPGEGSLQDAVLAAGVRAHLLAAAGLTKADQDAAAVKHVQIIQGELVPALAGSAAAQNVAPGISTAVGAYAGLLEGRNSPTEAVLAPAHAAALAAADSAMIALGGAVLDTAAGRAALVEELLGKSEEEYREALQGGPLDREPYETAYGYFQVASEQYRNLQGIIRATQPNNLPDLDQPFEQLALAFPSITDPANPPVEASAVEAQVDRINATLTTYTGTAAAPADVPALIAATRAQVAKALTQYTGGQADAAYETAAGAYLNQFEALEGPLGKKDQALVGQLEGHFKDLRDGIKAGKSQADIQTIADKINAGLDKAQTLLSENS